MEGTYSETITDNESLYGHRNVNDIRIVNFVKVSKAIPVPGREGP
jgi:hypothetical protein